MGTIAGTVRMRRDSTTRRWALTTRGDRVRPPFALLADRFAFTARTEVSRLSVEGEGAAQSA
jgi:hypothetical protein